VVHRVYIDATHEVKEPCATCGAVLRSSTDVRIDVPWYARMLTRMITQHIGVSVGEKNRAVAASLCTARAGPALLQSNASFLTPPREELLAAHVRRRRRGDGTGGPRLWRLRTRDNNTQDCDPCTQDNTTQDNTTQDNTRQDNTSIA
jgi:hypothetical protein